jgi:GrpB-like predicted nucleotidyltransferase (UPF0157 family)
MSNQVVVEPYNPDWALQFSRIRGLIAPAVKGIAIAIEHVGSTSVVGLAAKPTIDIDIIIPDRSYLSRVIVKLEEIGYKYCGDLGIRDRDAFRATQPIYRHNLYVCPQESAALKNHLCLRDSLRADSQLRDEYSELKCRLAIRFPQSIDDYIEGKTEFILGVLRRSGYAPDSLEEIRIANLAPSK